METINAVWIHPADNVCTLLRELKRGECARYGETGRVTVSSERVPVWHKVALHIIPVGCPVIKYGCAVAVAREEIPAGGWVNEDNVSSVGAGCAETGG